jgi:hypothetical protein
MMRRSDSSRDNPAYTSYQFYPSYPTYPSYPRYPTYPILSPKKVGLCCEYHRLGRRGQFEWLVRLSEWLRHVPAPIFLSGENKTLIHSIYCLLCQADLWSFNISIEQAFIQIEADCDVDCNAISVVKHFN